MGQRVCQVVWSHNNDADGVGTEGVVEYKVEYFIIIFLLLFHATLTNASDILIPQKVDVTKQDARLWHRCNSQ